MAELAAAAPEAVEILEAGSEAAEEVPDIPGPRNFVILQEDDSFDLGYRVGSLDLDFVEGDRTCEVAAIAVIEDKLLVALPEAVWSKSVQKRRIAARGLTKPNLVAVAACLEDSRESEADIVAQLRVWVGFLHPELERSIEFLGAAPADFPFGEHGGHRAVPFAPALVEVANEQFNFFITAESNVPEAEPNEATARLDHLEAMMRDMKSGLDALLGKATGGATVLPTAKAGSKKTASAAGAGKQPAGLRGLDPAIVENALQAGIPAAHLREVGKIMKERPLKRLEEIPRQRREAPGGRGPLSETEEEGDVEQVAGDEDRGGDAGSASVSNVEKASRCWVSSWKRRSSGGSKRNAAALRALTKCLKENPKYIYTMSSRATCNPTSSRGRFNQENLCPQGRRFVDGLLQRAGSRTIRTT